MTIKRAFAVILLSGLAFAIAGGVVGYALAKALPSYYVAVFPRDFRIPNLDPVEVGLGLGISQGLLGGLAVGSVVVLAVSIAGRPRDGGGGAK